MSTPSPTTPGGAPSSAPSPGSAAAGAPLRIDTRESWARVNTWLGTPAAGAAGASASEAKRLLGLAMDQWGQPGQAAPLVLQACKLAGLEPVAGDDLVVAQPAQPAPTTPPAQPAPTTTPAQPAPRRSWLLAWAGWSAWQRLVVVSAVIAIVRHDREANFTTDLSDMGLTIMPLYQGRIAELVDIELLTEPPAE